MKNEINTNKFSKEEIEAKARELAGKCIGLTPTQINAWAIKELHDMDGSRWVYHAVPPTIGKGARFSEDDISFTRAIKLIEG